MAQQEILCPACRGGNSPQARHCQWCGALLAVQQPQQPAPQYTPPYRVTQAEPQRKKRSPLLMLALLGLCLFGGVGMYAYLSSPSADSGKPPEYVKEVVSIKEGEKAFQVYFILADEDQVMTSSDGTATLRVVEDGKELYKRVEQVRKSEFQVVTRGRGAFENTAVVYDFGRITYTQFASQPEGSSGEVAVTFTMPEGRTIEGKDTVFFDE